MSTRPHAATSSELIREAARDHGDGTAYSFEGTAVTFAEFDAEVDLWAKALLALGVKRGEAVSILAGNHPVFLQLAFGAARIGAHLAPLNTWHKTGELAYTLRHSESVVLFTVGVLRNRDYSESLLEILPELGRSTREGGAEAPFSGAPHLRELVSLGEQLPGTRTLASVLAAAATIDDDQLVRAESANTPDDLMYLLYTSGSTSLPKGVMSAQGDLIENGFQIGERQGIVESDRSWLATPLFYGLAALQGVFATWTHFAAVVLQESFEAVEALKILEQERCTVYFGFGNLTRKLLSTPGFDRSKLRLRKGMIGFSEEDKRLAIDEMGITSGVSAYGSTEVYGLAALTDSHDPRPLVMATQGHPLPGVQMRIADPDTGRELPPGVVGSLQIKGRVTPGYFRDAARTAEAFTADGYFITGDLARIDHDGRLVYQGRSGEMIKTGGINVSPQEVESLLDQVPGIRQAYVCGVPHDDEGECIVAFVEADERLDAEAIKAHLRQVAASYKIPRYIYHRTDEAFPRLASGKIALPALKAEALQLASEKASA